MTSLRRRLFVLLLAATGALWLCAVIWIYVGSRIELEHVLDTRLQEAARMVHSLVASGNVSAGVTSAPFQEAGYERQLSCQIWSLDGRLVAKSSGAPDENLTQENEGFADRNIGGESWRVYPSRIRSRSARRELTRCTSVAMNSVACLFRPKKIIAAVSIRFEGFDSFVIRTNACATHAAQLVWRIARHLMAVQPPICYVNISVMDCHAIQGSGSDRSQ